MIGLQHVAMMVRCGSPTRLRLIHREAPSPATPPSFAQPSSQALERPRKEPRISPTKPPRGENQRLLACGSGNTGVAHHPDLAAHGLTPLSQFTETAPHTEAQPPQAGEVQILARR